MRTVVFDVETGGLTAGQHPIIQIAAVACDESWDVLEEIEVKLTFDPASADPAALEANCYDAEVWARDAIHPVAAIQALSAFLRRHADVEKLSKEQRSYKVARLAAHNARFDRDHLLALYQGRGEFLPAAIYEALDTLELARWVVARLPPGVSRPANLKLATLCEWLGIALEGAHDAQADARATVLVAKRLTELLDAGVSLASKMQVGWAQGGGW